MCPIIYVLLSVLAAVLFFVIGILIGELKVEKNENGSHNIWIFDYCILKGRIIINRFLILRKYFSIGIFYPSHGIWLGVEFTIRFFSIFIKVYFLGFSFVVKIGR